MLYHTCRCRYGPLVQKRTRTWTKQSDNEMILLHASLDYMEKNPSSKIIRRALLKKASDQKLNTQRGVSFGGTFERALRRLEEKGAWRLESKGTRRSSKTPSQTLVHLNPTAIRNIFDEKRRIFNTPYARPDIRLGEESELEAEKWEKIVRSKVALSIHEATKHWINLGNEKVREINSISKDAAYVLAVDILTRMFNVRIRPTNNKALELTEEEIWQFAKLCAKIASRKTTQPFTLTMDYSGYSMETPLWMESALSKISPYIMKFADAKSVKLSAEDIYNISEARITMLRPSVRALFERFWKNHVTVIVNDILCAVEA